MADDVKTASLMRRFVSTAPPGHLHLVMKSLKAVVKDDELFYALAPRLCLEHMATYGLTVALPNGEGQLVLSRGAHAPAWGTNAAPAEMRSSIAAAELSEEYLTFAFVDWLRRSLCIVDPLLASVIERVPLCQLDGERDTALARLLEVADPALLSRGLGFNANTLRVATFLSLRDALQVELSAYAARRYAEATVSVSVSIDLPALAAEALEAPEAEQPTADARCNCASFSIPILRCAVFAERRHETACWAGRWVTQLALSMSDVDRSFTLRSEGGVASPRYIRGDGTTRVDFTYYEAGNIQMESTEKIDFVCGLESESWVAPDANAAKDMVQRCAASLTNPVKIVPTASGEIQPPTTPSASVKAVADRLVRLLEKAEDTHQERITEASRGPTLSDTAMRPLRKKLPVTRQLYDFGGSIDATTEVRKAFTNRGGQSDANASYAEDGALDE